MVLALASIRRRAMLEPFTLPGFAPLWSANLLWYLARWMEQIVLGWLVLELTNSPWLVALIGFWRNGPLLFFGLLGGELADRVDRRHLLLAAQLVNVGATLWLIASYATNQLDYTRIAVAQVLMGTFWAIDWPARRSAMMDIAGPQRIVAAVLLDATSMNISRIAGPLLGGSLIVLVGVGGCFSLLVVLYLTSTAALLLLRLPPRTTRLTGALWRNLGDGLRYCWSSGTIMAVLWITVAMNMLAFPHQQLLPVFARDILGVGPVQLGLLAAADGLGSLVGGILLASWGVRRRRPGIAFAVGSMAMCSALLLFAFSQSYLLSCLVLVVFGLGHAAFSAFQSTIILSATTAELRGRAMGVLTIAIGTFPLGAVEIGALAAAVGAPLAVFVGAAAALIGVAWAGLRYPDLRRA